MIHRSLQYLSFSLEAEGRKTDTADALKRHEEKIFKKGGSGGGLTTGVDGAGEGEEGRKNPDILLSQFRLSVPSLPFTGVGLMTNMFDLCPTVSESRRHLAGKLCSATSGFVVSVPALIKPLIQMTVRLKCKRHKTRHLLSLRLTVTA